MFARCWLIFAAAVAVSVMALAIPEARANSKPVVVSDVSVLADGPFCIALEKGYFADAKVAVQFQRFASGSRAIASLSTNQVQVAGGALSAAMFNAFACNWPVVVAMSRAYVKALRDFCEATRGGPNRADIVAMFARSDRE
jgi:ABC-type nitrate/sulfonate/bicarbonate transport system substrate-binding protein